MAAINASNLKLIDILFLMLVVLTGCGPSERERDALAERERMECLDKLCVGDVGPEHDVVAEVVIKLNGQFYLGPREYYARRSGAVFYWPTKLPAYTSGDFPEGVKGQNFYDIAIGTFLNTPHANASDKSLYRTLLEMDARGLVLEKGSSRAGLQVWRTRDERQVLETWYVASSLKEPGGDPPTIACRETELAHARCTTRFRWLPDMTANMRFRAFHGPDWPGIYLETERVLKLLRKA